MCHDCKCSIRCRLDELIDAHSSIMSTPIAPTLLVCISTCDKITPGILIARRCACNIPAVFVPGPI